MQALALTCSSPPPPAPGLIIVAGVHWLTPALSIPGRHLPEETAGRVRWARRTRGHTTYYRDTGAHRGTRAHRGIQRHTWTDQSHGWCPLTLVVPVPVRLRVFVRLCLYLCLCLCLCKVEVALADFRDRKQAELRLRPTPPLLVGCPCKGEVGHSISFAQSYGVIQQRATHKRCKNCCPLSSFMRCVCACACVCCICVCVCMCVCVYVLRVVVCCVLCVLCALCVCVLGVGLYASAGMCC
jgi:hypothetical protein